MKTLYLFSVSFLLTVVATAATSDKTETKKQPSTKEQPSSTPEKEKPYDPMGFYFGGFGGWGYRFSSNHATQSGTAFFPASAGGPLAVNAKGRLRSNSFGFGGVHFGYEWMQHHHPEHSFRLTPGAELEAYYFAYSQKGDDLINPTVLEHDFEDKFPMRAYTVLANATLAFDNNYTYVSPYIGGGVGTNMMWIHGATSTQTSPPEPGINHFNSKTHAFDWVFAVQAKAGLRYTFYDHYRLFADYRFHYASHSKYNFGATVYPSHVPTTKWKVKFRHALYNLFSAGIDFTW